VEEMTIRLDTILIFVASLIPMLILLIAEAMVFIAIIRICTRVAKRLMLIIIVEDATTILASLLILIVSTIGGVEIMVKSVLTTTNLFPPILGVFTDHLIARATTLGVIVVSRNGDYILGIDLDNHGVTTIGVREVREILDRAEVQSA
jgi:hypothetical protein